MRSLIGLFLLLSFAMVKAENVKYTVNGQDAGVAFTITVEFDNEASNISNDPIFGWQSVLTIPDGSMTVDYGGTIWHSQFGIRVWYGLTSFDASLKLEALSDPSGFVNIAETQVIGIDPNAIFDPNGATSGNVDLDYGNLYLYLNDVGIFTNPNTFLDPFQTTFAKSLSGAEPCSAVQNVISNLEQICFNHYCGFGVENEIGSAVADLQASCP